MYSPTKQVLDEYINISETARHYNLKYVSPTQDFYLMLCDLYLSDLPRQRKKIKDSEFVKRFEYGLDLVVELTNCTLERYIEIDNILSKKAQNR